MKRHPSVQVVVAFVFAAAVVWGVAAVPALTPTSAQQTKSGPSQSAQVFLPQPDTSSPSWKAISDDLGIWIDTSDRLGVRGRLFVRRGGLWAPVAVDGAADILGAFPAGK